MDRVNGAGLGINKAMQRDSKIILQGRPRYFSDEEVEAAIEPEEGDLPVNYFHERRKQGA